ncbi:hypothetical protein ACFL0Y_03830 [Patescibacteria group bacterium]
MTELREDPSLKTKIRAKVTGGRTQRRMEGAIQTTGELIGRRRDDFHSTASEVIKRANRIRAEEMGMPQRFSLDSDKTAQWLKNHGEEARSIDIQDAMEIVHSHLEEGIK